jgi:hypothetical protein
MRIPRHYLTPPEEMLVNKGISFTAKGVFSYLMLFSHPESQTAVGISMTMDEKLEVVESALRELNATGYVELDAGEASKPDKRDPFVTELVEYFESVMQLKMPRAQFQRRAAKTMIKARGLQSAKRAIDAAAACRDQKYAPRVLSLEDLRDKWNMLVDFYRRNGGALKQEQADAAVIEKMTRTER